MNIYLEIHRDDNELKLAFPYAVLKQEKNVMLGFIGYRHANVLLCYLHVHVEPDGAHDAFPNFHLTLNATVPFLYLVSWIPTLFEYPISFSSFLLFIVPSQFL